MFLKSKLLINIPYINAENKNIETKTISNDLNVMVFKINAR